LPRFKDDRAIKFYKENNVDQLQQQNDSLIGVSQFY